LSETSVCDAWRQRSALVKPHADTVASRSMRIVGLVIAVFVVFHLLHLTTGTIHPARFEEAHVYDNLVGGFRVWWVSAIYLVSMIAIGLHLFHGGWSWLRTLGLSRPSAAPLRRPVAAAVAIATWAGLSSIPVALFFGLYR